MKRFGGDPRGSASGLRQGSALHPRRVFDPLDTLLAIELSASAYSVRVFIQRTYGSKKKQNPKSMKVATEGFQRATTNFVCFHALWSRPQTRNPLRHAKSRRIKRTPPRQRPQKSPNRKQPESAEIRAVSGVREVADSAPQGRKGKGKRRRKGVKTMSCRAQRAMRRVR